MPDEKWIRKRPILSTTIATSSIPRMEMLREIWGCERGEVVDQLLEKQDELIIKYLKRTDEARLEQYIRDVAHAQEEDEQVANVGAAALGSESLPRN